MRQNGASVPNIVGSQLGGIMKQFMNVFAVILLLLVGVVFVLGPAKLLGSMTSMEVWMWVGIIFGYYISRHSSPRSTKLSGASIPSLADF